MAPTDYLMRYCDMTKKEAESYLNQSKEYQQSQAALTLQAGGMGGGEERDRLFI